MLKYQNIIFKTNNKETAKTNEASLQLSGVDSNEDIDNEALRESDIRKFLNTFDIQEQEKSDKEAVDGTDEQKKEYEKQKQLIINSIQTSLNSVRKYLNFFVSIASFIRSII